MAYSAQKIGRFLARLLFINVDYRKEPESFAVPEKNSTFSINSFVEKEPTLKEWLRETNPGLQGVVNYFRSLFPFWSWIFHYNLQWLMGDIIAGVTVGFVVVPQGMAYALLAKLPPEFGLYTSFVGFLLYWAFATSKDITIGTVAVMSTIVGNIVIKVQKTQHNVPAEEIARALSVICGSILLFIGLTRLGWIVEFIPLVTITSFMTGAAINIAAGQVPALMGISGINTRDPTYKVIINTLKKLPKTKLDAALGLTALFILYFYRWVCNFMAKKQPHRRKFWFFTGTLRMAFIILLYILISWLSNRHIKSASNAKFKILGKVPRGFRHAGVPKLNTKLIKSFASDIPASVIVLIIEHIAISKSFGRINNYTINPSQELVAIGFTNILGPFLGAYPATGSFSRTAIKSKAGVRTPLAGIFTAILVLLALYALTSVFFYIPMSALSALIIHAVGDLITPPDVVYQFWKVSPLDVFIFFTGVFVTIFSSIENGIYATIAMAAAVLLYRIAKAKGRFLGKVTIYPVPHDRLISDEKSFGSDGGLLAAEGKDYEMIGREAFIPLDLQDGTNPQIRPQSPYPGIFIYRFSEGFNYPNQAHYLDGLTEYIFKHSRRTHIGHYEKIGDRPWNDPGPRRGKQERTNDTRPILRAIILDFSAVNNVDVTAIQALIDVRNQLDGYAAPETVEWHIACISNRWTKRALASAGFGYPTHNVSTGEDPGHWKPIVGVAQIIGGLDTVTMGEKQQATLEDEEIAVDRRNYAKNKIMMKKDQLALVQGLNKPFFHIDVASAVQNAVENASAKSSIATPSSGIKVVTSVSQKQ